MENPSRALRRCGVAAVLALAAVLLAARPAAAQFWVAADRSIVNLGQQYPIPFNGGYSVTPVVLPGNMYARVSGPVTATFINPNRGYPGTGFIMPFYANDRARAANFYGLAGPNPQPVITGPFQKWW
jgi:hypothetical protein